LRIVLFTAISLALGALANVSVRLTTIELGRLSPSTREGVVLGPIHRWIAAGIVVGVGCWAWSYLALRRIRISATPQSVPLPDSRRARVLAPALVFCVFTILGAVFGYEFFRDDVPVQTWLDYFWAFSFTEYFLPFAVWLTSGSLLVRAWRNRGAEAAVVVYGVRPAQFATLLCFNLAAASLAGFLAAWAAFALWLTPWYRWFP
jgi:hypothetical protein